MTWDVQEYILPCECRRRERSPPLRIAILPRHVTQPWEVLKINQMRVGLTSLAHDEHLLLVVDKRSKFPFACPPQSKQANRVARELLQVCLTFAVPKSYDAIEERDSVRLPSKIYADG